MTVYVFTAPDTKAQNSVTINATTMRPGTIQALLLGTLEIEVVAANVRVEYVRKLAYAINTGSLREIDEYASILSLTYEKVENHYENAIQHLINNRTHEELAEYVVRALATAYAAGTWNHITVDRILSELYPAIVSATLPETDDTEEWQNIALDGNIYDKDQIEVWS